MNGDRGQMALSRRVRSARPAVEALEARRVPSSGSNRASLNHVPTSFLFTPIPEGTPLAEHIHPILTIVINGQQQVIPTGIGLGPNGDLPIHTHDSSGIIHVESTVPYTFHLQDFFTIWGQPFSRTDILGHTTGKTHRIVMFVDGQRSNAFGSLPLRDLEDILIEMVTVGSPKH